MTFEDNTWARLLEDNTDAIAAMAEDGAVFVGGGRRQSRRTKALLGGGVGALIVAGLAVVGLGVWNSPPAFAVTVNRNGSVVVTLNQIASVQALNARLASDGINAKAIRVQANCLVHPQSDRQVLLPAGIDPHTATVTIEPGDIPPGYTAVLNVEKLRSGRLSIFVGAWPSPGPNCVPLLAPEQPNAAGTSGASGTGLSGSGGSSGS